MTCFLLAAIVSAPMPSDLELDEVVLFYPVAAVWNSEKDSWQAKIHGVVYQPETDSLSRRFVIAAMRRVLGISHEQTKSEIFTNRARLFLVDNERNRTIVIRIGQQSYAMESSLANGHFSGDVTFGVGEPDLAESEKDGCVPFSAVLPDNDDRTITGTIKLVSETGVSVISDIDDTIKVSNVADRSELMANSFLRPFEPAPGMASWYAQLESEYHASFHYVSSSPWQLYTPLQEFTAEHHFPAGTFQLQAFRLKDSTLTSLVKSSQPYKLAAIRSWLAAYPKRTFILIGDSGEKDPEIYGEIYREMPKRIQAIYIRNVSEEVLTSDRMVAAMKDVPKESWFLFTHPKELSK